MAILGTIALIALVVLSLMVLRVKSDPKEKRAIREALADAKRTSLQANHSDTQKTVSYESPSRFEPPSKA